MILKQAVFLFLSLMTIVTAYDPDWALHPKIRDGPIRILHGITHLIVMKRYIGIIALFVGLSSCESLYEDGEWYRVTVPHKGECRKAVITVDQNLLTRPRQATVQMQSGNSFTNIIIYQP